MRGRPLGLVGTGDQEPDVPGRAQGREGERHPYRRRLRGASHADRARRPLVQRRVLGEERGDVRVGPDPEHEHVERRDVLPAAGCVRQLSGVAGRRGVDVRAVGPVQLPASGAPAPGRGARRRAGPRGPGSRCARRRPAGRNRSSPHQMSSWRQSMASRAGDRPSDSRIAEPIEPPVSTMCAEPRDAWASTIGGDQPRRRRVGEQLLVAVDDDAGPRRAAGHESAGGAARRPCGSGAETPCRRPCRQPRRRRGLRAPSPWRRAFAEALLGRSLGRRSLRRRALRRRRGLRSSDPSSPQPSSPGPSSAERRAGRGGHPGGSDGSWRRPAYRSCGPPACVERPA